MGTQVRELLGWAKSRKLLATFLVTCTLAVGILIGTVINGGVGAVRTQGATDATPLAIPNPVQLSSQFALIASRVEPAVVNISTTQVIQPRTPSQRRRTPGNQDQFQDFFDRFFDFPEQQGPQADRSLGSGVIVDKKGYILTNLHVVDGATKIKVRLPEDRNQYDAKLIGSDTETDLAVIKIDATRDLPVAKMGNSDSLQVGDWVMAFGSPFGLEATATAGIISAKDRSISTQQFQRFLQTDAAINPGNSGGPLVNMAGEIIGINTAIVTTSRGFDGVGFALPSNTAVGVYNQLIKTGRVTRGSIGITFTEANSTNPVTLKELGAPYGIIIEGVEPGSPAEKAGMQPTDVITSVNGRPVKNGNDLVNPIVSTPLGDKVHLTYLRDKKQQQADVTVEDRTKIFPQTAGQDSDQNQQPDVDSPVKLGLRVEAITPDLARRLGYEGHGGVIVAAVEPGSFAEDINFLRSDIIVEINREAVNSPADFRRVMGKLKAGDSVVFRVMRRSTSDRFLTVLLSGVVPEN